jgi:tRNA threonylcarbamoyladenosine biosynthesis protein TsaB
MYLVINTLKKDSLVALGREGRIIDKNTWHSDLKHSEELLPRIDQLLRKNEVLVDDLSGIVTAVGPGSYTGIRVGVSTSNALGFALKIPVVGVNCLEFLAYYVVDALPPGQFSIVPLIKSVYDKFYNAVYRTSRGLLRMTSEYASQSLDEIVRQIEESACFVGEIESNAEKYIKWKMSNKKVKVLKVNCVEDQVLKTLAKIGSDRLGEVGKDSLCTPLYINRPHITVPRKR